MWVSRGHGKWRLVTIVYYNRIHYSSDRRESTSYKFNNNFHSIRNGVANKFELFENETTISERSKLKRAEYSEDRNFLIPNMERQKP